MHITLYPQDRTKRLGDLFGIFFEDLNHAADGGLYAELIQNRDFEFDSMDNPSYHALTGWESVGGAGIAICSEDPPFPNNPHYASIKADAGAGIANLGYHTGIPARAGSEYRLIIWARASGGMRITATLCGARAEIELAPEWKRYEVLLISESTQDDALIITASDAGRFEIAFVSLMDVNTWRGRKNGLRNDIAQALSDMKPKFMRFPGGCLTHDGQLDPDARDGIYSWKRTLGPVENRPARRNNWGYHQSMGLGFYEYFLLCEDMGCEPLPVVNGGIDPHHLRFAEGELLEQYIQDAVDLIDFAKGGTDTQWGRVRAEMGHPEPFTLKYLAVGNEEIHERFHENMARFVKAIRAKDPSIKIIGSASPVVHGKPYDMGWAYARKQCLEFVDEHYYQAPEWFLANWDHYADYPSDGPQVFLGEYASWSNTMESALAEAAYMTGLQTAPGVGLACYAPMLCHVGYVNWKPDMLWFDNRSIVKTPNYHVQSMFMRNQGDWSIPMAITDNNPSAPMSCDIAGLLQIMADETSARLTDVRLTTRAGTQYIPDCTLEPDGIMHIAQLDGDFVLEFKLERLSGRKGVLVRFGQIDDMDYYQWTVGGWQNSDSGIDKRIHGRSSCLTQSNLYLKDGRTYDMKLELHGREIITTVDGEELNRVTERALRLKPLYAAASIEESTGDIILKAVNVQDVPVCTAIDYPCTGYTEEVLCAPLHAENTLATPECVAPVVHEHAADNCISHMFPGHSVTILRLHKSRR